MKKTALISTALILCIAFCAALIPTASNASQGEHMIPRVQIFNLDIPPVAGERATDHCRATVPAGQHYVFDSISWHAEDDFAEPFYGTFEEGKGYRMIITVRTDDEEWYFSQNVLVQLNGAAPLENPYLLIHGDGIQYCTIFTSRFTCVAANTPTPRPTAVPTPRPTAVPTPRPTAVPTPRPTAVPTPRPTATPTPSPTAAPTPEPTAAPTPEPTLAPTPELTEEPTPELTLAPTPEFTEEPAEELTPAIIPPVITDEAGRSNVLPIIIGAVIAVSGIAAGAVIALRRRYR